MLWDEPKIFFLERRYFFSIILSEFLKNRVALHRGLEPEEIWLIGASQRAVRRTLRHILPDTPVRLFPGAEALPLDSRGADTMIFAAGNLAGPGKALMERVRKEGEQSVL